MLEVEVDAGSIDLLAQYASVKRHMMSAVPAMEDRWAVAAMLMVAAARQAAGQDDPYGTFTVSNLPIKDHSPHVTITIAPAEIPMPEPVEDSKPTKLPKPKMKTSIPPKKGPVRKNQEDDKRKRKKVGEDLYVDGNGYYFNSKGQAVGKNGKPTVDPYNINIDPNLDPVSTPVVPMGSAGVHGTFGGDDSW